MVTLVTTTQTMSFRYELARKGFSAEKAHHLVTAKSTLLFYRSDLYTVTLFLKLSFYNSSITRQPVLIFPTW